MKKITDRIQKEIAAFQAEQARKTYAVPISGKLYLRLTDEAGAVHGTWEIDPQSREMKDWSGGTPIEIIRSIIEDWIPAKEIPNQ